MHRRQRIPVSWSRRWALARERWLPLVAFAACAAGAAHLWGRQSAIPATLGEVQGLVADVLSPSAGVLAALGTSGAGLDPLEPAPAGALIARLDEAPALAALAVQRAELERLRLEVAAARESARLEAADRTLTRVVEGRRLRLDTAERMLDVLDRRTQRQVDTIERDRLSFRLEAMTRLSDEKIATNFLLRDAQALYDAARARVELSSVALAEAEAQLAATRDRSADHEAQQDAERAGAEPDALIAPLIAALTVQEARTREVELQVARLEARAPIDGRVTAVHRRPGQYVAAGDPIVTLASDRARHVVAYLRPQQLRVAPRVGMTVAVRGRVPGSGGFRGRIDEVGNQILPVPPHQLRDPKTPEWGLPIRIPLPSDVALRPGELVSVSLIGHPGP